MVESLWESLAAIAQWLIVIGMVMAVAGGLVWVYMPHRDGEEQGKEDRANRIGCNCAIVGGIAVFVGVLFLLLLLWQSSQEIAEVRQHKSVLWGVLES